MVTCVIQQHFITLIQLQPAMEVCFYTFEVKTHEGTPAVCMKPVVSVHWYTLMSMSCYSPEELASSYMQPFV